MTTQQLPALLGAGLMGHHHGQETELIPCVAATMYLSLQNFIPFQPVHSKHFVDLPIHRVFVVRCSGSCIWDVD